MLPAKTRGSVPDGAITADVRSSLKRLSRCTRARSPNDIGYHRVWRAASKRPRPSPRTSKTVGAFAEHGSDAAEAADTLSGMTRTHAPTNLRLASEPGRALCPACESWTMIFPTDVIHGFADNRGTRPSDKPTRRRRATRRPARHRTSSEQRDPADRNRSPRRAAA